jgi:malonyl-CoA/methylmalonyl-CoA synthetase
MLLDLFDGALSDRAADLALDNLSFERLHDGANRVATRLAESGVRGGDRIAIYSENRLACVLSYVAALRLGAIAVPVNILYRSSDLSHLLRDAAPRVIVCSPAGAPCLAETGYGEVDTIAAAELERWSRDESIQPQRRRRRPEPDDIALIVYTSGTTGKAKGAMLSHRNLAAIASQLIAAWRWHPNDTLLLTLPLFHVHGLVAGLTTSLCAGSRVLLHERFDAAAVAARLARGDVTMFFGVPTMYVRLLQERDAAIPPLRLFVSGSAPLSASTHRAFEERFGAAILERYGATEFGFGLGNRYAGPRIAGSVGVPLPGVAVRIASSGGTEELDQGQVGELLVAGPNVFCGYWRQSDATAAAFSTDAQGTRWYRSGDLAQYDCEAGVYRIVGRIKDVIISGGFNIYPAEVEAALERFPSVRACAVVGKPDAARGEVPVAFVEADARLDVEAVLSALRSQLASFKVPKEIRILEALPRNAMGKLDKPALRASLEEKEA